MAWELLKLIGIKLYVSQTPMEATLIQAYSHNIVDAFIICPWITFRLDTLRLGCYVICFEWVYFEYIRLNIKVHSLMVNWYSIQIDPFLYAYDTRYIVCYCGSV